MSVTVAELAWNYYSNGSRNPEPYLEGLSQERVIGFWRRVWDYRNAREGSVE